MATAQATATAHAIRPQLTDEQLTDIMELVRGSDSVELKLSVADADRRATITALGLDPLGAQIRQVFFFDTPDLKLSKSGVVVRARRVQGRGDDSTVKLRPIRPDELTPKLRQTPGFKVEVDAMPGGKYVCSASMSAALGKDDVRPVAAKAKPIRRLFSKAQRAFYDAHAPEGIALDDLSVLGPIFVLKTKFTPERFGRPMVAEFWLYPDGTAMLELSTKCLPAQTFQTAVEARASLLHHGIKTSGEQNTKTRKALDIYSHRLRAEAAAAAKAAAPRRWATAARKPRATAAPKPRAAAAPKPRATAAPKPRARKPAG